MMASRFLFALLAALSFLFASGCGSKGGDDPAVVNQRHELDEIYDMYKMYIKKNGQPPRQAADLLEKEDPIHAAGTRVLKNNEYVVVWGLELKDSSAVLAYGKDAPNEGGLAILANGKVEKLSADEIKAATPGSK